MGEARALHAVALGSTSLRQERETLSRVEGCAERASEAANRASRVLQALAAEVRQPTVTSPDEEAAAISPAEATLRQQSFAGVSILFRNALAEYFEEQRRFRDEMQAKVRRQLRAAFPDADEEAVAAVAAGQGVAAAAIQDVLNEQPGTGGQLSAQMAVALAREKCDELEKLAQAAFQLRQAFADIESLVISQGEALDDIAGAIQATRDQTKAGLQYLEQSAAESKKCRWRYCLGITLLILIILVLLLALLKFISGVINF